MGHCELVNDYDANEANEANEATPVAGCTFVTIMTLHVHGSTKLDTRLRCGRWPGIGSTRRACAPAPLERRQLSRIPFNATHFDSADDRKCREHDDLLVGKRHVLISSMTSLLQLGLTQAAVADQVRSVLPLYMLMIMNDEQLESKMVGSY